MDFAVSFWQSKVKFFPSGIHAKLTGNSPELFACVEPLIKVSKKVNACLFKDEVSNSGKP